jgi:hypothetical protein
MKYKQWTKKEIKKFHNDNGLDITRTQLESMTKLLKNCDSYLQIKENDMGFPIEFIIRVRIIDD